MVEKLNIGRQRKNVTLTSHRTSICLEDPFWKGLTEICRREEESVDDLCAAIIDQRLDQSVADMTSSLRVFQIIYFRIAAEHAERTLAHRSGTGFSQPPQTPFPSIFDMAVKQFIADQKNHEGQQKT